MNKAGVKVAKVIGAVGLDVTAEYRAELSGGGCGETWDIPVSPALTIRLWQGDAGNCVIYSHANGSKSPSGSIRFSRKLAKVDTLAASISALL